MSRHDRPMADIALQPRRRQAADPRTPPRGSGSGQPQLARLLVHAAGGGVPDPVPGLSARARHLDVASPTRASAAAATSSASRITSGCGTTAIFWLSVFNTLLYTIVASAIKFAIGLYLALLLNGNMPFKAMHPRHCADSLHRADGAVGDRVLVDLRRAVFDHLVVADQARPDHHNINFLGDTNWARDQRDLRQYLARRAVRRDHAAGRPADRVSPRCTRPRRSTAPRNWQTLPLHHLSAADADHRGRDDVLGAVHLHRLPADLGDDPRRPGQRHASDGDACYQRGIIGGQLGEGAAIATAMIPFLLAAIMISWFGMQRRKWQQGENND